jgi:hypothetical protein
MAKTAYYRAQLATLSEWEPYLLAESGLPGPRGNLELAQAAVDLGDAAQFRHWLFAYDPVSAPTNTPGEFVALCGAIGLGKLIVKGEIGALAELRPLAGDPRWRVREGVAMALQRWGDEDMPALLATMKDWSQGTFFAQRAAVAALCEPRLLVRPEHAHCVLAILDRITAALVRATDRREDSFRVLRQALGYGWSVAVVALPGEGLALMERYLASPDHDVSWIMRENLKKARLARLDAAWVAAHRQAYL